MRQSDCFLSYHHVIADQIVQVTHLVHSFADKVVLLQYLLHEFQVSFQDSVHEWSPAFLHMSAKIHFQHKRKIGLFVVL